MWKNALILAWRHLRRHPGFTLVNVLGLGMGTGTCLLIALWVRDEYRMDAFHSPALCQVYEREYRTGQVHAGYLTQGLLADELKRAFPEVQYAGGLEYASMPGTENNFEAGGQVMKMAGRYAGADFFFLFNFPLLQGHAATALRRPESLAISRRMAESFFGSPAAAMGRTLRFEDREDLQVTAVFVNLPAHSSLQLDFLRSWSAFVQQNPWVHRWDNTSPRTFVKLRPGASRKLVEAKMAHFLDGYLPKTEGSRTALGLQPFREKYLHGSFRHGYPTGGRISYVRIFSGVALFILLIACINFMNLATARSATRAKEIGLRKVIGARRGLLVTQFTGEALLLSVAGLAAALVLTQLALPAFGRLSGKTLSLPYHLPAFWALLAALVLITAILAGSYPTLYLSALNPARALKSAAAAGKGNLLLRKGLVVFQFVLSVGLIIGMMVIYRQMAFIQTVNLGYDRQNLACIPIEGAVIDHYAAFKEQALRIPGVLSMSKMRNTPTEIEHHASGISWPGKDPSVDMPLADAVVGYDFVKTMRLQLAQGRDFSRAYGTDSTGFLLNETAVRQMGLREPIGQVLHWGNRSGPVIGVLKDFHFTSLHDPIDPLIVRLDEHWSWGTILVRIQEGRTPQVMTALASLWRTQNPRFPFTYTFSDAEYTRQYRSEQVISRLSDYFALLAILISCLGLFGLATFVAEQRTREIGVRKVLGASVPGITALLSADFLKLVLMAVTLASPLAWWLAEQWLQHFAYRVKVSWWIFVLAGGIAAVIALATVSYQAMRTARLNPVKSLRAE